MSETSRLKDTMLPPADYVLPPFEPIPGAPEYENERARRDHEERVVVLLAIRQMESTQQQVLKALETGQRAERSHRKVVAAKFDDVYEHIERIDGALDEMQATLDHLKAREAERDAARALARDREGRGDS